MGHAGQQGACMRCADVPVGGRGFPVPLAVCPSVSPPMWRASDGLTGCGFPVPWLCAHRPSRRTVLVYRVVGYPAHGAGPDRQAITREGEQRARFSQRNQ
jgi:hypothetical protein